MVGTMGVLSAAGAKATIQGELLRDFFFPFSSVIWGGKGGGVIAATAGGERLLMMRRRFPSQYVCLGRRPGYG